MIQSSKGIGKGNRRCHECGKVNPARSDQCKYCGHMVDRNRDDIETIIQKVKDIGGLVVLKKKIDEAERLLGELKPFDSFEGAKKAVVEFEAFAQRLNAAE